MSLPRNVVNAALCALLFASPAFAQSAPSEGDAAAQPAVAQPASSSEESAPPAEPDTAEEAPASTEPSGEPAGKAKGRQQNSSSKGDFLDPAAGSLSLGGEEGFGIGTAIGDPTALYGPDRTEPVLNGTVRSSTINVSSFYSVKPADNQRVLFELNFDPAFVGADISYSIQPKGWDGLFTVNGWMSSARFAPFEESFDKVFLPNYENPYLQQGGLGVEYMTHITKNFDLAAAINYQNYAFSDSLFGGDRFPVDVTNQLLTLNRRNPGEVYSLNLHGIYSTMDDRRLPTEGYKVRFAAEQGVAMGNNSSSYTRLATNLTGMFVTNNNEDYKNNLLLNLQAGTILGTAPNVRSFHMGGAFSVRGYNPGEMASGTSFLQATAEYRHHLTDFTVFDTDIELRGAAFVDYGSVLGTMRNVRGIPEYLYEKPTNGTGYGVGLHFATDYGLFRIETAWNNRGENNIFLAVGERF